MPTLEQLVVEAGLILSILVPSEAVANAERVAQALQTTGARAAYADCNAIAPATMQTIGAIISEAEGACIDAGIIGGPPRDGYAPRLYASGRMSISWPSSMAAAWRCGRWAVPSAAHLASRCATRH